jgi:hypothetical protein
MLGRATDGPGEGADPGRIDSREREAGGGCRDGDLEAAGRLEHDQLGAAAANRAESCSSPCRSWAAAKLSPVGRRCTSSRSLETSMPTSAGLPDKAASPARASGSGLAPLDGRDGRPKRLFGLSDIAADEAPHSDTGSATRADVRLPTAASLALQGEAGN